MSRAGNEFGGPARERSGWLIPLAVFLVTAVLTGLVLLYYLSPSPSELIEEQQSLSDSTAVVSLSVGSEKFHIAANYLPYPSARKGGAVDPLKLIALLPDLDGYSSGDASEFADDSADSRVLHLNLRAQPILSEEDRMARIYMPQVDNQQGAPGPYGLTQYTFLPSSSYRDEELFVGKGGAGIVVLRCTKPMSDTVAPTCLRDTPIAKDVGMSYRFKRRQLEHWRDIDKKVREMIAAFRKGS